MVSISWALLLFLAALHTLLSPSTAHNAVGNLTRLSVPFLCHPDQANTLLKLKKSFSFGTSTTMLRSWRDGTDCCLWEGVSCDAASGNVTILDLSNRGLSSNALDPVVFSLTSLRRLDLSMNNFGGRSNIDLFWLSDNLPANIPATGFERLTSLTHLNLSNSGFFGQLPISISKLVNLVSLDLSSFLDTGPYESCTMGYFETFTNSLREANFGTLLANLINLRELYLDGVDLSSSGEDWCISLASSVPHLQVLSLANCGLSGPIHKSLARLDSLSVIDLHGNDGMTAGTFPEFFLDFLNLTVLQLSNMNLEGRFPSRPFRSKNLRVLDLSGNAWDLTGHFPNLSNSNNSLQTLRLRGVNFPYAKQTFSSSFQSLKELSLDGGVSIDFLSSFGKLRSLRHLVLSLDPMETSDLISVFSWIGYQENLQSLLLDGFDFHGITPSSVRNFKNLRSLTMVECHVPRLILSAVGNLMDLQTLEMRNCTDGSMLSSIGSLTNLRNLCIINCPFSGPMPDAIGNLTNLRNMYIDSPLFSGPMPDGIGNLVNLRNMHIYSGFSGPIPVAIGNLTKLKALEIYGCFSERIPYAIGQLKGLTRLVLQGSVFSGSIPSAIVNLTQLTTLDLSYNSLSGVIPPFIFTLPVLRNLDLSWNQFSGAIQEFDKAPSQLQSVDLSNNELSGPIPKALFQLINLKHMDISSNNLMGLVDLTSFFRLSDLSSLHLSDNKLHVMDSSEGSSHLPTDLSGPNELGLMACSITRFPRSLMRINYMSHLDLSCNQISGDVPNQVWEIWSSSLIHLNLSHNMFTSIGLSSGILPFTNALDVLDLSFNRLQGWVPMPNSSARILDYSNNLFSFILPNWASYLRYTTDLNMSANSLYGRIPITICNSALNALDLSYNNFSGPLPSCLIETGQLWVLNLRKNHFKGTSPSNIANNSCSLLTLDLHGNEIQGLLPRELSHCTDLVILDVGGNRIADTFPSWLMGFSNLRVLVLRSNQFYGTINDTGGDTKPKECFPRLQILDLASNNFSGSLRPKWFERLTLMMSKSEINNSGEIILADRILIAPNEYEDSTEILYKGSARTFKRILTTTLTLIDLSNNRFEGAIPESVGRLVSLRELNLSHNDFKGNIPTQLGGMTDLESLDLSWNQLTGVIPQELTNLTFLGVLNLSNNHLVGKIPQSRQFSTFDSSSFEGNAGLCGQPLSESPCGASPYTPGMTIEHESFHHVDVVLFLFVGLGFGVGFAAAIVVKLGKIGRWFGARTARASRT